MKHIEQLLLIPLEQEYPELELLNQARSLDGFANRCYSPYPNPALQKFVETHATNRTNLVNPLPENLVAGKNSHVYDAHTYHTKVPPEAIARLIEHYTEPGNLVLDPFCGSGMTGVAALRTQRKPILTDLSPAATFIAMNFLTPIDGGTYQRAIKEILTSIQDEERMLYGTHCRSCGKLIPMEYMVWSYGLICEFCQTEFILWDVARDEREDVRESKIKTEFDCPHCDRHLQKRKLRRTQLYPVQIGYRCCDSGLQETQATPADYDLEVIAACEQRGVPIELWYPTAKLPNGVNTRQVIAHGLDSIAALYTPRNLHAVARLWNIARRWPDETISAKLLFTVTSLYQRVTRLSEFRFWGGSGNIANYNVPMIFNEQNVFKVFRRKAKTIQNYLETWPRQPDTPFCISTQSATDLHPLPDNSIDYIFTDPPFGSNINYSEMNYLWEAWLGVFTDVQDEAIVNRVQNKTIENYQELMTQAFNEMYRVLKPDKWLTLEFHNSSAEVWAAIQKALSSSGFRVELVQTLDKRHGTFKQFVSDNAVGYDLMLHCQKTATSKSDSQNLHYQKSQHILIQEFLRDKLSQTPEEFIVRYLHVKRQNELDTRKLYSLWLKENMEVGAIINLDYEEFRKIITLIIDKDLPNFWVEEAK